MRVLYLHLIVVFFFNFNLNSQTTWDGISWNNGSPNLTTDAIIDGAYTTASNGIFNCNNLNVTINGNLTISENTTIQIQSDLNNLGAFTVENTGSLIMIDDSGTATGTVVVKRDTPNYLTSDINSFYSSPLIEADSNMASIFNSDDIVFYWDTTNSPTFWVGPLNKNTTNFLLGKGYAARPDNLSGVITRTYTGQVNTGDVTVAVNYSDSSTSPGQFGYNIIGNPYPSAIDWFAFKEDNASLLSGTMYYWRQLEGATTNYASDYVALNYLGVVPYNAATEFIGVGQGFVVKTNATGNVVFKNSHRVDDNSQFFRNQSRTQTINNSWFNLEGASQTSTILIGFNENATTGFDNDYDGVFIGGTDLLQLYSLIGNEKLLINGQPELQAPNNVSVPLGIVTPSTGNYTISIEEEFISTDYFIRLEDTETNITTDLRLTDYTFNVNTAGETNSRFIMHYEYNTTLGLDEEAYLKTDFKAFFSQGILNTHIIGNNNPQLLNIYDVSGKTLFSGAFKNKINLSHINSGVYFVEILFQNRESNTKSVINKK